MTQKMRWIAVVCLIVLTINCLAGCSQKKSDRQSTSQKLPVITVGSDNYPPYNYEDADGKPAGIDVDIAQEAFRRMGYQAEFAYINWEDKKDLVESGKIDCIWGCFTIDGREDTYHWTSPYMVSRQVVAVTPDSNIYSLADLKGKRVIVQSATKPDDIFSAHTDKRLPKLKELFTVRNRELLYPYLSKGYADALAAHEVAILQYMKDYDLEYRILKEPLQIVGIGVAFAKNDQRGIEKKLSEQFTAMKKDGSLQKIVGNYLDDPEKYLEVDANESGE